MTQGSFIAIEGGEGSGKGTQLKRLGEAFPNALLTREPGGSPYAERIRDLLFKVEGAAEADGKTQFGLFWAARADHMAKTVLPALAAGKLVFSDRADASTYAYQIVARRAEELEAIFWQMREVYLGDHKPDLYLWLDVDPAAGLVRTKGRYDNNHHDALPLDFHERVREGYARFFEKCGQSSVRIDANQGVVDVWHNVHEAVKQHIG